MKNICFFHAGVSEHGGIGRVVSILTASLVQSQDIKIFELALFNKNQTDVYRLDDSISRGILYSHPVSMKKVFFTGGLSKLCRYLKDNKIDVIIACGALFFPLSVFAAKSCKIKCICWEHTSPHISADYSFQRLCRWIGAKASTCNVLLTKQTKEIYDSELCKKNKNKNIVIYNPIDPQLFSHLHNCYLSSSKRIISVGRFHYQKNYECLVRVATKILPEYPDWCWDIYGDGDLKTSIQQQIDLAGIGDQLKIRGQSTNLYDLYGIYSFLVMTSRYEGFPMTLLEASANRLPLISFDCETGPSEIIENGVNGYLINDFNEMEMIERIIKLITDEDTRIKMSKLSEEKSKLYNCDEIKKQWINLINNLTST